MKEKFMIIILLGIIIGLLGLILFSILRSQRFSSPKPSGEHPDPKQVVKNYQKVETGDLAQDPEQFDGKAIELLDVVNGEQQTYYSAGIPSKKFRFYPPEFPSGIYLLKAPYQPGVFNNVIDSFAQGLTLARIRGEFHVYKQPGSPGKYYIIAIDSIEVISEPDIYKTITLNDLEQNKNQWDRARVEYTGIYESRFEHSFLDKTIWLEYSSSEASMQAAENFKKAGVAVPLQQPVRIKVRGRLYTKFPYGHRGSARYLIRADEIEVLK